MFTRLMRKLKKLKKKIAAKSRGDSEVSLPDTGRPDKNQQEKDS
jgi:hypothetical protein